MLQAGARHVGGGGGRGPRARVLLRHLRARQAFAADAHAAPPRPPHARSVPLSLFLWRSDDLHTLNAARRGLSCRVDTHMTIVYVDLVCGGCHGYVFH